jgi:hypothetical protein
MGLGGGQRKRRGGRGECRVFEVWRGWLSVACQGYKEARGSVHMIGGLYIYADRELLGWT